MKKKATVSRVIIFWALGILVVFLVMYVIAGPGQLLAKTRDAALFFGLGNIPGEERPELLEIALPTGLVEYFDNLVATINTNKDAERCLILPDEVPNIGDHRILLSPGRAQIIKLGRGGFSPTDNDVEIDGFIPCVVAWEGAENFYDNWLDGSIGSRTPEYYNLEAAMTLQLKSGNKLITPGEGSPPGREYDILEEGGKLYIYKADNEHFCFISSHGGGDCELSGGKKSIEEGCVDKMPSFETGLLLCDDVDGTTAFVGEEDAKDEAEKIAQAIQNGLASSSDRCLVGYDALDLDDGWKLGMYQDGSNIQFAHVVDNGKRFGNVNVRIPGNLCLVEGGPSNGAAWNLYRNLEFGESRLPEFLPRDRLTIEDKDGKYQITVGEEFDNNPNAYFNLKDNNRRFLYKADSDHVCFFTLREDHGLFDNCDDAQDSGIDDECYKDWIDKKELFTCDEKSGKSPVEQELIDSGYDEEFRKAAIEFFNGLKNARDSNEEICKVKLDKYPGFDGQRIKMEDIDKDGNMKVIAEGKAKIVEMGEIDNLIPCIVHAENFMNWIEDKDNTGNQYIPKEDVTIKGKGGDGFTSFPPQQNHDPFEDRPLLYKAADGFVCLIPTHNDWVPFTGGCSGVEDNNVDNDCLREWLDDKGIVDC